MGKGCGFCLPALLVGLSFVGATQAQGPIAKPWEEHAQMIESRRAIGALDMNLFGDSLSYYTGGLSFSVTDVDLPGNNELPVSLTRVFHGIHLQEYWGDGSFSDWSIDLPSISGIYLAETGWVTSSPGSPQNRCSTPYNLSYPPVVQKGTNTIYPGDYWHGMEINIPGRAGGDLLHTYENAATQPASGSWPWMTNDWTYIGCLSTLKNSTGEGFMALTADGTRYWFDWMATAHVAGMLIESDVVYRRRYALYATRVEDRFGNWVEYTYTNDPAANVRPTRILASDGRQITISYNGSRISSVAAHGRTWSYAYAASTGRLSSVTLPDSTSWTIDFSGFIDAWLPWHYTHKDPINGEPWRTCESPPDLDDVEWIGRITHPSGVVGKFTLSPQQFGRSMVPRQCARIIQDPGQPGYHDPYQNYEYSVLPVRWDSIALVNKHISGPAVPPMEWNYQYVAAVGFAPYTGSSSTVIVGPQGDYTRYIFGNRYQDNEGLLLSVERGSGPASIQHVEATTYQIDATNQPFPERVARSSHFDRFGSESLRPVKSRTHTLQGVQFSSLVSSYDVMGRPLSVTQSSTLTGNPVRTESTQYHDNLSKWILGQPSQLKIDGIVASETSYNADARPTVFKQFGRTVQTLSYDTTSSVASGQRGTLKSIADGNNNVVTLTSWKRGIPQSVKYPATPESSSGAVQAAVVNDHGWITRSTDENGYQSNYHYDSMGRLSQIIHPTGDSVTWNPTTFTFTKATTSSYGIPAGHWQHTVATGNGRKVTYLDALWRPLLEREYDIGNAAGTQSFVRRTFDHESRVTFTSYPSASGTPTQGTWNEYDALGRPTSVSQDSELGLLTTSTAYLSGFQTRITNPRGQQTTTRYLAWDQPTTDYPIAITHPGGAFTDISRDVFGKPVALTRRNSNSTDSLTRSYVYDAHQQLCKSVEPETAATIMAYDAAGNLAWSKAGATYTGTTGCNINSVPLGQRTVRTYDARNRIQSIVFPDNLGNTSYAYTPDGLLSQITVDNGGADIVSTAYTYNRRRLLTGEALALGTHQWGVGYGYNANGNLQAHTLPGGMVVDYAPNALGQPSRAGSYATGVSYFPNGAIKQFTYGNGIVRTYTQNARGLPERSRDVHGSTTVHDDSLDYDQNGNVAAISDGLPGNRGDRTMSYDALDRLTGTVSPMFGTATYTYDVLDSLRTVRLTSGTKVRNHTYGYDPSHRLTSIINTSGGASVATLAYDLQGNLANRNGQAFQFDHGNRLRNVPGLESYLYDGHGRRVRALRNGSGLYSMYGQDGVLRYQRDERTGKTTEYVHLGGQLVAQAEVPLALATPALTVPGYSSTGSYTATWTASAYATKYQLQERLGSGSWTTIHDASATSRGISGKAAGSWGYRVRACSATICGNWSTVSTTTVQLPPTAAPALSLPANGYNGGYTVSWSSVPAATKYQLQERLASGSWNTVHDAAGTSKTISGKAAGSWGYRVRACNDAGCGTWSATGTVQVILTPGSAPTLSVPATNLTGGYSVTWGAVAGTTRYELQERQGSGSWDLIHNAGSTSKALSGKATGNWGYRARACNEAGCSSWSATSTVAVTRPPTGAPTATAPSTSTTGSYSISWTTVTHAASYQLQEQLASGSWATIHDAAGTSKAVSGKSTGNWSYRVRACNAAGCGGWSSTRTVVVTTTPPATPVLQLTLTSAGSQFTASWNSVAFASSYRLQEQLSNGTWVQAWEGTATSRTFSKAHGVYRYQLRACNAAGCSAWGATRTIVLEPPGGGGCPVHPCPIEP